jgi:threonine synthase
MSPTVSADPGLAVAMACAGCGTVSLATTPFPARCPHAVVGDDIDHVMVRRLGGGRVAIDVDDPNPFVRYRQTFRAWHVARAAGWSDERYVGLVQRLDRAVAAVDGHGFRITPFERADGLSASLGFTPVDGIWVKDETGGVAGSHKARHLMGIMLELLVAETLDPSLDGRPLAIASCGNAALAAAVVAHAAGRRLDVFVPADADPDVLARLERLHARIELVARATGERGDPTVRRLHEAIGAGAIPFTCQGPLNGLAIEGGETLGLEIAESIARDGMRIDRLIVQVGGGALATACAAGLTTARSLGLIETLPVIDAVQTAGAWPLRRAYERLAADLAAIDVPTDGPVDLAQGQVRRVIEHATHHRSDYMWPWETVPYSVAHGILDDETYDWLAVVEAMLLTGGHPVVVDEADLIAANELARRATRISVDATGSAGLAGLLHLQHLGAVGRDERVAVLFTGVRRDASADPTPPAPDPSSERRPR